MRYLLLTLILTGCATLERSANRHLKIAERHMAKAKMKGALSLTDTVYIDIITKETITDTVALLSDVTKNDTIFLTTAKWSTKTVIRKDTIWQEIKCPPDTIRVPVKVITEVTPDKSKDWHKYLIGFAVGIALIAAIFILKK